MLSHPAAAAQAVPDRTLSAWHAAAICVGMVIGAGIFITTPLAAANLSSGAAVLGAWLFGGAMSLAGALCFAEMASAFPDAGGDYNFLRRAYGDGAGFLFAWSRFAVIHTGSMALLAFTFGDYLAEVVPLGAYGAAWFAAATIVVLAAVNLAGLRFGIGTQVWLLWVVVGGMLAVIAAGAWLAVNGLPPLAGAADAGDAPLPFAPGAALVFVFLAYGGWSDTATLSAEVRDARHGIMRALLMSMILVTLLYVLVNWAYLRGLSHLGLARSEAPAADLLLHAFGAPGQTLIVGIVALTSITSMNAILIAGARTTYAAARDTQGLARLGGWQVARGTPRAAIVATRARARRVRRLHARRFRHDGRLSFAGLLAVPDAERNSALRAAAPLSLRAAAVSRAGLSLGAVRVHRQQRLRAVLELGLCARRRRPRRRGVGGRCRAARGSTAGC
jgi:APA family basic amino acid/polyamine antiporter